MSCLGFFLSLLLPSGVDGCSSGCGNGVACGCGTGCCCLNDVGSGLGVVVVVVVMVLVVVVVLEMGVMLWCVSASHPLAKIVILMLLSANWRLTDSSRPCCHTDSQCLA